MATNIGFWTPVQYADQPVSLGQKIGEYADAYFHLGGRVAVAVPGVLEKNSSGIKMQEESTPFWKTALKAFSYATLVIPASVFIVKSLSRAVYSFHECSRVLPDGTEESGIILHGELFQGVRIQGDRTVFLRPELLHSTVELSGEGITLNFAEVTINGQKNVIPVQQSKENYSPLYTRYSGSPYEALAKMAQFGYDWDEGLIDRTLRHPDNKLLDAREFLTYLLTPSERGTLPLHTVKQNSLKEILKLAQEHEVAISVQDVDFDTHETLFSKWAGVGDVELTQALLAFDPSAIRQTEGRDPSFFMKAVLSGHEEEAQALLQAMQAQNVKLTLSEQWLQKAFSNDCNFTKEQFSELPSELGRQLYQIANTYMRKEFLQKLRDFGMYQQPAAPEKAALFSYNMDAIDVEDALRSFLGKLRKEGLLLTREEFAKKDPAQYFCKRHDVGRILGRDYIERTAERLGLPYIRVPKKMAVIDSDASGDSLEFTVSKTGNMGIECPGLQIYAEKIKPIDRDATREEILGLFKFIEEIRYNDFGYNNVILGKNQAGEEGFYFIDTEYKNFSHILDYHHIEDTGTFVAKEDLPWLREEVKQRWDSRHEKNSGVEAAFKQKMAEQRPAFVEHGFADRRKPFSLAIADLVSH